MPPLKKILLAATTLIAVIVAATLLTTRTKPPAPAGIEQSATAPNAEPLLQRARELLAAQRKIIVLLGDEAALKVDSRRSINAVGQAIFHDKLGLIAALEIETDALLSDKTNGIANIEKLLDYIESDADLFDADRLAFRETLRALQRQISKVGTLPAAKLHKRVGDDLDALAEIEKNYEREMAQIFSRFEKRAITQKREKWGDYLVHLAKRHNREQILKDYAVIEPYSPQKLAAMDASAKVSEKAIAETEIYGKALPPKTIVLTFDDGPHPRYTDEIEAILKQYGAPAVFFQVGKNLGSVAAGKATLGANAKVATRLSDAGFEIANHSFSHSKLSKANSDDLKTEITNTDALLREVNAKRSPLFRFPYGAGSPEGLRLLSEAKLKSVMWNIDSLDWADPVPRSIADRVLREIDQQGSGIVLFHDIHERTVKALPLVLDRLVAEGYKFAAWDGQTFSVKKTKESDAAPQTVTTGYANSWAILIGIDDYAKWPKLSHAVNDTKAMQQTLVQRFGFAPERVVTLTNGAATRTGILSAFHDKLAHAQLAKNDRVFVFFAGHGATRKLSSGRDLGYIVPVDADPAQIAAEGIAMTEIQNIAESLTAKHVLFVMDSCYSGLGLTRGGGNNFLRENAKRIGRQMLTAGGADEMVADNGPNGHSVFTWTLLQALQGKGDLNGDGFITATELAAYVAPAVAGVAAQTPAFGSLPGSQGGEFVFELPVEAEFLNDDTKQLSGDAIALNTKLDAMQAEAVADNASTPPKKGAAKKSNTTSSASEVVVPDLQGRERTLPAIATVGTSVRQQAQRANDKGLQLYREKRYAEAESAFTEALKLRADFALAANNLGFVFYKQDKFAEAARWFEQTLKLDPSRAVAYLNLGEAFAKIGNKEKARAAYQSYLALAPAGTGAAQAKAALEKL